MPVTIAPYLEEHIPAVKEFNRRLQAGGAPADYVFSESHIPVWLPRTPGAPVYNEFYLALEGGAVRGTYVLKHQAFSFRGEIRPAIYYHHPFSEGIVDKKYTHVGPHMLMHAMRAHPVLFALGMGGYDRPLPRMLMALKWDHCLIPFYFRVNHPARFLRNMQTLRQGGAKRALADLAAFTGAGWAGIKILQGVAGWREPRIPAQAEVVEEFGEWVDEVWDQCRSQYAFMAVRDRCALRTLYPVSNRNFIRLRISSAGRTVGWAVLADRQMEGHPQYGNLRVGIILDGLSRAEDAGIVISAATRALIERDVDVITSNQSRHEWVEGLKRCGFLKGPSNFIFATSKKLSEMIHPFEQNVSLSQINRGDGDSLLQYCRSVT